MYKNILAAVGEYSNSEIATRYAIALAKGNGGKLFLVHIDEGRTSKEKMRPAEEALERLFIRAKNEGVDVESLIVSGPLIEKLVSISHEKNIDILFIATRSDTLKARPFAKTTAKALMEKLTCAVAVVRVVSMGGVHPKNILVFLKNRLFDIKERAFFVVRLAEQFQSKIVLFCLNGAGKISGQCEEFKKFLESAHIVHERKKGKGDPSRAVRHEAIHRKSDLIVIEFGRRSLWRSFLRSHPLEELLRDPPCNLIIFKKGKA